MLYCNRRARALLEYLIDSRIFECSEDEVVLLESLGIDTESGYTASLVTAAIFEYLQEELNRGIDELAETESELEDTEIVSHVLEEYTLVDAQELEQELAGTVESLASLGDAFAELEAEARQVAAQRQLAGDIDTPHMRTLVEDITSTSLSDMEVDDIDEQLSDLTDSGSNYPL